jgi:tRNA nucleotidyltransferase/poly(A) polymerase
MIAVFNSDLKAAIQTVFETYKNGGFSCFLVGGAVRDTLCGIDPKDWDFATNAPYEFTIKAFDRVIETGLKHGTLTVIINNFAFEITRFRADSNHDGRFCEVSFVNTIEEDLSRRDFTFNALAMDFDGKIFDPFEGQKDLHNGVVRFVGDANSRIQEDYLRIFRYVRFFCRFGKHEDEDTIKILKEHASMTDTISGERIWDEFNKLIKKNENVELGFELLHTIEVDKRLGINGSCTKYRSGMHPISVISTMIEDCDLFLKRIPISNDEKKLFYYLVKNKRYMSLFDMKTQIVDGVPKEYIVQKCLIDDNAHMKDILEWDIPVFPLTGDILLSLGYETGAHIGEVLKKYKTKWIDSNFTMTIEEIVNQINTGFNHICKQL